MKKRERKRDNGKKHQEKEIKRFKIQGQGKLQFIYLQNERK